MYPADNTKKTTPPLALVFAYVILIGLPLVLIFSYVDEAKRSEALLLLGYTILIVVLYRMVKSLGRSLKIQPPFVLRKTNARRSWPPMLPPQFDRIRSEIKISTADRKYFHRVFKKRILGLIDRKSKDRSSPMIDPDQLERLLGQRLSKVLSEDERSSLLQRGVSLEDISAILHRLEGLS